MRLGFINPVRPGIRAVSLYRFGRFFVYLLAVQINLRLCG